MSNVLLIAPPYGNLYGGINIRRMRWGFVPYGIACIGGFLRAEGHNVRIIDTVCGINNWRELRNIIQEEAPDFLGAGATTPQFPACLQICEITKQVAPRCTTIVGGPHASALPKETLLNKHIDIVVRGEGEIIMSQIAKGMPLCDIKGIAYKKDGRIIVNQTQDACVDLDTMPLPLYEQLPIQRYGTPYLGPSIGIISGRGCPFSCSFCASKIISGGKTRSRSIASVLHEISWLKNTFGIRMFSFWDDTFTLQKERVENLCAEIISRNLDIQWSCTTRVDTVSLPLLRIMKKAGCRLIHLGIESGDDAVLEKTGKGITVQQARNAVALAQSIEIQTYGYFILGLPDETQHTLSKTIAFAKELKLDYAQFALLTPLPGTEIWKLAKEGKKLWFVTEDFAKLSRYGKAAIALPNIPSETLTAYYRKAYRNFYFRGSYILQAIKNGGLLRNLLSYLKVLLGCLPYIS